MAHTKTGAIADSRKLTRFLIYRFIGTAYRVYYTLYCTYS